MITIGETIPNITLSTPTPDGPKPVNMADVCAGKRIALFAVPGAFTPTCSARHLPGYLDYAAQLKRAGIDQIACVAVNDAFVMGAWSKAQNVGETILMLADGNGDWTRAIGLSLDATAYGMGERSQRYAMVIDNGVVKALYVEEGGAFAVSSAEHMLKQLEAVSA